MRTLASPIRLSIYLSIYLLTCLYFKECKDDKANYLFFHVQEYH